jgi:hypothetical protein
MASIGTTGGAVAVTAVLQWVAAASVRLPPSAWPRFLPAALRLLFRISTLGDSEASSYPASVRALAQETGELLQSHVGVDVYVRLLAAERNRVAAARLARRRDRAVERVLDPQAAAQAKAKRQAAKLRQKKRKVDEFRMQKGKASRRHDGEGGGAASANGTHQDAVASAGKRKRDA